MPADLFEKLLGLGMWIEVRVQRLQGVRGGVQAVLRRGISAPPVGAAVSSGDARRRHCLNHPSPITSQACPIRLIVAPD